MFHLSKPLNRLSLRLKNHWLLPCDLQASPMIMDRKDKRWCQKRLYIEDHFKIKKELDLRHKTKSEDAEILKENIMIWCRSHTAKWINPSSIARCLVSKTRRLLDRPNVNMCVIICKIMKVKTLHYWTNFLNACKSECRPTVGHVPATLPISIRQPYSKVNI